MQGLLQTLSSQLCGLRFKHVTLNHSLVFPRQGQCRVVGILTSVSNGLLDVELFSPCKLALAPALTILCIICSCLTLKYFPSNHSGLSQASSVSSGTLGLRAMQRTRESLIRSRDFSLPPLSFWAKAFASFDLARGPWERARVQGLQVPPGNLLSFISTCTQ